MKKLIYLICLAGLVSAQSQTPLENLTTEFIEWRTQTQPITSDDIPRIERPEDWVPDLSPLAIAFSKRKYEEFRTALDALPRQGWTRSDSVDYLLLRSAIERVNWELNILDLPGSHPEFYVNQTVGLVFDLLALSSPFTQARADALVIRLNSFPQALRYAQENLQTPIQPFARITIGQLSGIRGKLNLMARELAGSYPDFFDGDLQRAAFKSGMALEVYSRWLEAELDSMSQDFAIGTTEYEYFLKNIALVPYSPEELLRMGEQEWERSVAFETLELLRNVDIPPTPKFKSFEAEIEQARIDEQAIRDFLVQKELMTVPEGAQHYTLKAMPAYLAALAEYGELDDFTSPSRLDENSVRYIPDPNGSLGFFYGTAAHDPRPLIIHEGVPGHYFQFIQTWQHERPIRRFYIDSNANEGIGFYVEEMLLNMGLLDDRPHTREIIYRFMRLRALRVAVDINLALGNFSIEQAAEYLEKTVPMDQESARSEAAFFAATPGQALTYQIGKLQILKLISDARLMKGDAFQLKDYHDYMMLNGNVPIALQRWEYLGLTDEINAFWE